MLLIQNAVGQSIPIVLKTSAGVLVAGATSMTPLISKNGTGGFVSVGVGRAATEVGNGLYVITLNADEVDTEGFIAVRWDAGTTPVYVADMDIHEVKAIIQPATILAQAQAALQIAFAQNPPSTPPAARSVASICQHLYAESRNKQTVNKATGEVTTYADDNTTVLSRQTWSDTGTVLTRNKEIL